MVRVDNETLNRTLRPGEYIKDGNIYSASGFAVEKVKVSQELKGACSGIVVDFGQTAYKEFDKPWCKKGDRVFFKRYEGCNIEGSQFGEDGVEYMAINDTDIWAVIGSEKIK